jgi:hypothetical protein
VALTQRVLADNTILREMGTYIDISSGDESDEEREMALTECAIAMWRKETGPPEANTSPIIPAEAPAIENEAVAAAAEEEAPSAAREEAPAAAVGGGGVAAADEALAAAAAEAPAAEEEAPAAEEEAPAVEGHEWLQCGKCYTWFNLTKLGLTVPLVDGIMWACTEEPVNRTVEKCPSFWDRLSVYSKDDLGAIMQAECGASKEDVREASTKTMRRTYISQRHPYHPYNEQSHDELVRNLTMLNMDHIGPEKTLVKRLYEWEKNGTGARIDYAGLYLRAVPPAVPMNAALVCMTSQWVATLAAHCSFFQRSLAPMEVAIKEQRTARLCGDYPAAGAAAATIEKLQRDEAMGINGASEWEMQWELCVYGTFLEGVDLILAQAGSMEPSTRVQALLMLSPDHLSALLIVASPQEEADIMEAVPPESQAAIVAHLSLNDAYVRYAHWRWESLGGVDFTPPANWSGFSASETPADGEVAMPAELHVLRPAGLEEHWGITMQQVFTIFTPEQKASFNEWKACRQHMEDAAEAANEQRANEEYAAHEMLTELKADLDVGRLCGNYPAATAATAVFDNAHAFYRDKNCLPASWASPMAHADDEEAPTEEQAPAAQEEVLAAVEADDYVSQPDYDTARLCGNYPAAAAALDREKRAYARTPTAEINGDAPMSIEVAAAAAALGYVTVRHDETFLAAQQLYDEDDNFIGDANIGSICEAVGIKLPKFTYNVEKVQLRHHTAVNPGKALLKVMGPWSREQVAEAVRPVTMYQTECAGNATAFLEEKRADVERVFKRYTKDNRKNNRTGFSDTQETTLKRLRRLETAAVSLPVVSRRLMSELEELEALILGANGEAGDGNAAVGEAKGRILVDTALDAARSLTDLQRVLGLELLQFRAGDIGNLVDIPVFQASIPSTFKAVDMTVVENIIIELIRKVYNVGAQVVGKNFDGSRVSTWTRDRAMHGKGKATTAEGAAKQAEVMAKAHRDSIQATNTDILIGCSPDFKSKFFKAEIARYYMQCKVSNKHLPVIVEPKAQ